MNLDKPSKDIQDRISQDDLLTNIGYEWSNEAQLYYDAWSFELVPLNEKQAHLLAKRIMEKS
ncbi:hypothetical protein [Loigolactobacillus jiayinensis]|uniref:Uncharacterized protein n=1 Tax=Loigolactobacillus jiayinensis TaxID=2486016 RepID=A0ABW1RDA9_9LACO|nr:hypothetical protein [Loigolactobacillus jiayinensis]